MNSLMEAPQDGSHHEAKDISLGDDVEAEMLDLSCYITVWNASKKDFLLDSSGIVDGYGVWPPGQPLNTIEAGTTQRIHLQDKKMSFGGSQGWTKYEVRVNGKDETFELRFDCPQSPGSYNSVTSSSSSDSISIKIGSYPQKGFPLRCAVTVDLAEGDKKQGRLLAEALPEIDCSPNHPDSGTDMRVNYEFEFHAKFGLFDASPIHESIAIAAFIGSDIPFPKGTLPNNLNEKQWEYFRGLIWNDDPRCLLFNDKPYDNRSWGYGIEWYREFNGNDDTCLTRRSHFGDLQFLHAMGAREGEMPEDTRDKLLRWMEVMYKLGCGDQGVSQGDSVGKHFPEYFGDSSWLTLRDLLLATTPNYKNADLSKRALGVCLHLIQDSYAIGHVQRRLRNPEDLVGQDPNGYIRFRPGRYGDWGPIVVFHTYRGQNLLRHKHYDGVPKDSRNPSPRDLDSFNAIIGARGAIKGCRQLIDLFARKAPWKEVREKLEEEVFKLDPHAQPSNPKVDRDLISQMGEQHLCGGVQAGGIDEDLEYRVGLERKLFGIDRATMPMRGLRKPVAVAGLSVLFILVVVLLSLIIVGVFHRGMRW